MQWTMRSVSSGGTTATGSGPSLHSTGMAGGWLKVGEPLNLQLTVTAKDVDAATYYTVSASSAALGISRNESGGSGERQTSDDRLSAHG